MAFLTNTFLIEADIKQKKHIGKPVITANDTSTFIVSVQDNGAPMDMSKVTKAMLVNLCPDRQVFETVGVIQGDDRVVFDLPAEATAVAGTVRATVQLHGNDERVSTISFNYEVAKDLKMQHTPTVREKTLIEVALQDGPLYIEQAKTAAAKAEKVATENKTRWRPAVDTVALRNSTYPNPEHGDTVRVNSEATIYRFETGIGWIVTDKFSPTAIDNVAAQLAETAKKSEVQSLVTNKAEKTEVRLRTDIQPINVSEMDTETKQLFTGGAVAVVGEKAVGKENLKDLAVEKKHLAQSAKIGYPFNALNTWERSGQDLSSIGKGVKSVIFYGATPNDFFYIERIRLSGSNALTIQFGKVGYSNPASPASGEIVASISIPNFVATNTITSVDIIPNNGTSINGKMLVNWQEFDVPGLLSITPFPNYTREMVSFHQGTIFNPELSKYEIARLVGIPPKIYCTVGRELNLYFRNMINMDDVSGFNIQVSGVESSECRILANALRLLPTKAFNITLTINLFKGDMLIDTKKTNVISVADSKKTTTLLTIGDSVTANMKYTAELLNIDPNLTLLGTRGSGTNKHEGRSGWGTENYLKDQSFDSVVNAFFNPATNTFDFGYYMANSGVPVPSYVLINLGINDVAKKVATDVTLSNLETMINSIKTFSSSIKIILCVPIPPSIGRVDQHYVKMTYLAEAMIKKFTTSNLVGLNLTIDRETSFPTELVPLNSRNSKTIPVVTDTIHPLDAGYFQIADTVYGILNAV